ncbi:MAG: SEC-C domain-containing protein [Lautropia sp.]|nr:SEC-C domain-containing protein [Lautropia sp.]
MIKAGDARTSYSSVDVDWWAKTKKEIKLPPAIKEVFLFSPVAEHYPALAFQVRQSLKVQKTDVIRPPFVMDVFFLDTLTEMLETPLRLLSYVKLRLAVSEKLFNLHELSVLGYHLKQNLWLGENEKHHQIILEDFVARDLDTAMMVRRCKQPGNDTPEGILTKMRGTHYESLIKEIETREDPATLELGFFLLSMDEYSCRNIHNLLGTIINKTLIDGKRHDVTIASSTSSCGVCIHCNPTSSSEAIDVLKTQCVKRKYLQRAEQWFGVSVSPFGKIQFAVTLEFPWQASDEMEHLTANMKPVSEVGDALSRYSRDVGQMKIGRNELCHCGSGLKYKKCCLR